MERPEDLVPYRELVPAKDEPLIEGKRPPRITFINPGRRDETFWSMVSHFMKAVVEDIPIELEILNAERDHLLMKDMVKVVCAREPKPDYLILVNEKDTGEAMLRVAEGAGVKSFLLFNPLGDKSKASLEEPRARLKSWVGSLIVDQERAGYDIARTLLARARQTYAHPTQIGVLAISGNQSTSAATDRNAGLERALKEDGAAHLNQLIYSQWRRDKASRQSAGLLRRYPETRIIWAANDDMALGALDSARAEGFEPGVDVFIGGLNWATDGLKEVSAGDMVTSVGGHFMGGGWSLVMLYDHYHGADFAQPSPARKLVMGVIEAENVASYLQQFGDKRWGKVDFKGFSRALNSETLEYHFGLPGLMRHTRNDDVAP